MAARHALETERPDVSVYVLNMGQPVRIAELAENMIRLSGLEPGRDIEIVYTGLRPGERLNEILFAHAELSTEIGIPGIVGAKPVQPSLASMKAWLQQLDEGLTTHAQDYVNRVLREAVPDFRADAP
jgi:O-antigen biosynthesis protein WbqV